MSNLDHQNGLFFSSIPHGLRSFVTAAMLALLAAGCGKTDTGVDQRFINAEVERLGTQGFKAEKVSVKGAEFGLGIEDPATGLAVVIFREGETWGIVDLSGNIKIFGSYREAFVAAACILRECKYAVR